MAITNAKQRIEDISPQTLILFTNHVPPNLPGTPLKLWKILDLAPTTITDKTPMETVVNMFRKLGMVSHKKSLITIFGQKHKVLLQFHLKF